MHPVDGMAQGSSNQAFAQSLACLGPDVAADDPDFTMLHSELAHGTQNAGNAAAIDEDAAELRLLRYQPANDCIGVPRRSWVRSVSLTWNSGACSRM